jgi:hypothetical protein
MNNIKFRIRLKDKVDYQQVKMCIQLFDEKNGLLQFPIDLNKWDVLSIDKAIGFKDLYEKDIIEFKTFDNCWYRGVIQWGEFCYEVETTDGKAPILNLDPKVINFDSIKLLGNDYFDHELLEENN